MTVDERSQDMYFPSLQQPFARRCVKVCSVQLLQQVWGCPFDNTTDFGRLNLEDPYITDTAIVPAHSWTVIRIHFANPGD